VEPELQFRRTVSWRVVAGRLSPITSGVHLTDACHRVMADVFADVIQAYK
jgi:hypothetical protein